MKNSKVKTLLDFGMKTYSSADSNKNLGSMNVDILLPKYQHTNQSCIPTFSPLCFGWSRSFAH